MPTLDLSKHVNPVKFLNELRGAASAAELEAVLSALPIAVDVNVDSGPLSAIWQPGKLHWIPVGNERGNAGRIKLANYPMNPIAERLVNGMEALIELERRRELLQDQDASAPTNPRDAVKRYFKLPPLDTLPGSKLQVDGRKIFDHARDLARRLRVRLEWKSKAREFRVLIEDDGIGQPPGTMHNTLLSLGATTKADKPYLIGVFGQGGSSAYAASTMSWITSRRSKDLLGDEPDGIGWTVVKHVYPKGRRDDYFAYLAADVDGRVPFFSAGVADALEIATGTTFAHLNYDFGKGGSAISRKLYPALNHVLFNPILPYELYAGERPDPMWGNAYRLANLKDSDVSLDKRFGPQSVVVAQ